MLGCFSFHHIEDFFLILTNLIMLCLNGDVFLFLKFLYARLAEASWIVGLSVQFSRSVVSDSWRPHEWQHARPPCPSPSPGVHSNSCPSSQ